MEGERERERSEREEGVRESDREGRRSERGWEI